jgi:hypothetical protein
MRPEKTSKHAVRAQNVQVFISNGSICSEINVSCYDTKRETCLATI